MATKDGNLNDGRQVYLAGELVRDMHAVPVFEKTLQVIRKYYDLQVTDKEHVFYNRGIKSSVMFMTPKSVKDLEKKRKIYEEVSRLSYGMMGRTPDFINTGVAILSHYADCLGQQDGINFASNAKDWAMRVQYDNLFISHAIQNPQVDRSQGLNALLEAGHEFAGVWIKSRTKDGVIVRGAKQVNTLAPLADELLVFNLPGLSPEDDKFALAFSVPLSTPGVKVICRKDNFKSGYSQKDYPLTNAFDEIDAFIIFDDVFIPNELLFVAGDVALSNAFFEGSGLYVHTAHQDEVRGAVKLEFVTALAVKLAKKLGLDQFGRVQEMLGQLTINLEMIRAAISHSETSGKLVNQVFEPNMQTLLAVRASLTGYYDEALRVIAELSSGSAVGVPDFRHFDNKEIGAILEESLTSPLMTATERSLLLNLAWDLTGESFGQRQRVYEFLHGGNPMVIRTHHWQDYDLKKGDQMIDEVLQAANESDDS